MIFSVEEPMVESTAIVAMVMPTTVATVAAIPVKTPMAVNRAVNIGTSATPPVHMTAAIATIAPMTIRVVASNSF